MGLAAVRTLAASPFACHVNCARALGALPTLLLRMATPYDKWDKFDEAAALAVASDDEAEREAAADAERRRRERAAVSAAQDDMAVLMSRAAVADLKSRLRSTDTMHLDDTARATAQREFARQARELFAQASTAAHRAGALQRLTASRDSGTGAVAEQHYDAATARFQEGIELAQQLLLLMGKVHQTPQDECRPCGDHHHDTHSCPHDHHDHHDHGHRSHSHDCHCDSTRDHSARDHTTRDRAHASPAAMDRRVVERLLHDCLLGNARCQLARGELADAAGALRQVLEQDRQHVGAWLLRGDVFLAMGVPLLARMHYESVWNMDRTRFAKLAEKLSEMEALIGQQLPVSEADLVRQEVERAEAMLSVREDDASPAADAWPTQALQVASQLKAQAGLLYREAFYAAASSKFEAAVALLSRASDPPPAHRLRLDCLLGHAACLLQRKLQFSHVVRLATQALELCPGHPTALLRRGLARCALRKYSEAAADLRLAVKACDVPTCGRPDGFNVAIPEERRRALHADAVRELGRVQYLIRLHQVR